MKTLQLNMDNISKKINCFAESFFKRYSCIFLESTYVKELKKCLISAVTVFKNLLSFLRYYSSLKAEDVPIICIIKCIL